MRCPKCQSRGSPKVLTAKCVCQPDCVYVICRVCGYADHPFAFVPVSSSVRKAMAAKEKEPEESRSQEHHAFWPDDNVIRAVKPEFIIEERKGSHTPVWRRFLKGKWVHFMHPDALAIARLELELLERQKVK